MSRSLVIVLAIVLVVVGWTYRAHLPFVGSLGPVGSPGDASAWLVGESDQGHLGGTPGPHPARQADCTATSRPNVQVNPALAGDMTSFYDCRLTLTNGQTSLWCVIAVKAPNLPDTPIYTTGLGTCEPMSSNSGATPPSTAPPGSSTTTPRAPGPHAKAQLATFLNRFRPVFFDARTHAHKLGRIFSQQISLSDPANWPAAATAMQTQLRAMGADTARMAAIRAPAGFARQYRNYFAYYAAFITTVGRIANDMKAEHLGAQSQWASQLDHLQTVYTNDEPPLLVAMKQFAAQIGVTLPTWTVYLSHTT